MRLTSVYLFARLVVNTMNKLNIIVAKFEKSCPFMDLTKKWTNSDNMELTSVKEVYLSKVTQSHFGSYAVGYMACIQDVANKDMECIKAFIDKTTYEG